tara:strand:- start:15 stop:512 length:498 start_codon:yes stop_codon:yes gene_type:complete
MPQLEQTEFFVSQLFWLVLTFSFLLFFLWRISLPRISNVLERRENKINNDLESAKKQQKEAEEIQNQIEKQLRDANDQGQALIKESLEKMQKKSADELKNLDTDLNKKLNDFSLIVDKNKKESLNQINTQVHEITKLVLSKLSSTDATEKEIETSIDNIIKSNNN